MVELQHWMYLNSADLYDYSAGRDVELQHWMYLNLSSVCSVTASVTCRTTTLDVFKSCLEFFEVVVPNVELQHWMYLNLRCRMAGSLSNIVELQHWMYLNRTNTSTYCSSAFVELQHWMYLNG